MKRLSRDSSCWQVFDSGKGTERGAEIHPSRLQRRCLLCARLRSCWAASVCFIPQLTSVLALIKTWRESSEWQRLKVCAFREQMSETFHLQPLCSSGLREVWGWKPMKHTLQREGSRNVVGRISNVVLLFYVLYRRCFVWSLLPICSQQGSLFIWQLLPIR